MIFMQFAVKVHENAANKLMIGGGVRIFTEYLVALPPAPPRKCNKPGKRKKSTSWTQILSRPSHSWSILPVKLFLPFFFVWRCRPACSWWVGSPCAQQPPQCNSPVSFVIIIKAITVITTIKIIISEILPPPPSSSSCDDIILLYKWKRMKGQSWILATVFTVKMIFQINSNDF